MYARYLRNPPKPLEDLRRPDEMRTTSWVHKDVLKRARAAEELAAGEHPEKRHRAYENNDEEEGEYDQIEFLDDEPIGDDEVLPVPSSTSSSSSSSSACPPE